MSESREKGGKPLLKTNMGVPLKEWLKRGTVPATRAEVWNLLVIFETSRQTNSPWKRFKFRIRRSLARLNIFREEGLTIPKDVPVGEMPLEAPVPIEEPVERKRFDAA